MNSTRLHNPIKQLTVCLLLVCCSHISCKKFINIPGPKGKQDLTATFSNENSATAAVLLLYANYEPNLLYINGLVGLVSDEMVSDNAEFAGFMNNEIAPTEGRYNPTFMWATPYYEIRQCNLAIEGITQSTSLNDEVKNQLLGETLFMRAFMFFNLVNIYGGVPLTLSPIEGENAQLPRNTAEEVWDQIFTDLQSAKQLLSPTYPSVERARVNQYAVSALLARAYLYRKDWVNAEMEASTVIHSGVYNLVDPNKVFKNNSNETILQLYTQTGTSSIASGQVPTAPDVIPMFYLRNGFTQAFEQNSNGEDDLRKTNWIGVNNQGIHYINKYKIPIGSGDEYSILFRLGEMYLIRAEARAHQNNLVGENSAESDLNEIRTRAGLGEKTNLATDAMLAAIEQERKVELFGEYMHRWFDLKRIPGQIDPSLSRADEVLSTLKDPFWQPTDVLFPIPESQINLNRSLDQNLGYKIANNQK